MHSKKDQRNNGTHNQKAQESMRSKMRNDRKEYGNDILLKKMLSRSSEEQNNNR